MPTFFSHILKQKKIIFSLLLVFVVAGIILPTIAMAAAGNWWEYTIPGWNVYTIAGDAKNTLSNSIPSGNDVAKSILGVLMIIPFTLAGLFAFIGGTLLNLVILLSTVGVGYTANPAVTAGWPIVRDFANMVIVLALIVIALATILRWPSGYDAKKLLPRLIIAALLINFSLVICGIFIDISNITMTWLLHGGQPMGTTVASFISQEELNTAKNIFTTELKNGEGSTSIFVAKVLGSVFYFIMKGIVAFLFVFLFLFRIMALWILVILSPLAFACAVLPATKTAVFDKWWNAFLQWCFIGVFGALFLYLGSKTNEAMTSYPAFKGIVNGASTGPKELVQSLSGLFTFFVPGMFMVIGFLFSIQLSVMGSGGAIKAGKWVNNKVRGAVGGTLKATGNYTANKTGATRVKDNVVDWATRRAETWGFVPAGTTAQRQDKRMGDYKSRANAQTSEELVTDVNALGGKTAYTAKGLKQKAAQIGELTKRGDLYMLGGVDSQGKALQFASRYSTDPDAMWSGAKKKNPLLQQYNNKAIEKIMNDPDNPKFRNNPTGASIEAVRQAVEKANPSEAKEWNADIFKDSNVQMALDVSKIKMIGRGGSQQAKDALVNTFTDKVKLKKLLNDSGYTRGTTGYKRIAEVVRHIRTSEDFNVPTTTSGGGKSSGGMPSGWKPPTGTPPASPPTVPLAGSPSSTYTTTP